MLPENHVIGPKKNMSKNLNYSVKYLWYFKKVIVGNDFFFGIFYNILFIEKLIFDRKRESVISYYLNKKQWITFLY